MKAKSCSFWFKFDVLFAMCSSFLAFESLVSSLHNTHLAISSFGGIFPFSLELSIIGDDVCCFGVPRMIFLMYCCCEPLSCLIDKNLVQLIIVIVEIVKV